jgi:hypothetical protein
MVIIYLLYNKLCNYHLIHLLKKYNKKILSKILINNINKFITVLRIIKIIVIII